MKTISCLAFGVLLIACGGDDEGPCDPVGNTGCDDGLTCEVVTDSEPACFAPVILRGEVFDLADDTGIGGARVVALDVNSSPQSSVATTNSAGGYELRIPSERDVDGVPVGLTLTLRVDAASFQSFPSGIRQPLPIDTTVGVFAEDRFIVESALTQVGLIGLEAGAGSASIAGRVEVAPSPHGVLVVAETSSDPGTGFSAIADSSGDYKIFNLAAGDYTVRAYTLDANYVPASVALADAQQATADLALDSVAASLVSGNVILVEGSPATSVILVVASTFSTTLARGETPPALRAPSPGIIPNIEGAFSIAGVPAGRYVVLAAFENDGAVRDQSGNGGTDLVFVDVVGGQDLAITTGFKVTEAITLVGPGAEDAEAVTAAPTLSWLRDSSAKDYHVQVFDALGEIVMDAHTNDGAIISLPYTGPLDPGMFYQFRVTSFDDASPTPNPIANTEELRGVFFVP